MSEKNTDNQVIKHEHKFWLIIILLLIICCLEFVHLYKVNETTHKHIWLNKIENFVEDDCLFHDCKKDKPMDIRSMQQNAKKIRDDLKNKVQQNQKNQMISSESKQQYNAEKGIFIIEMQVPKNLTNKNIVIDLKDSILGVGFGEVINSNDQQNVLAVNQFFAVPQTKATTSDVKYGVKDGLLMIIIPIIK